MELKILDDLQTRTQPQKHIYNMEIFNPSSIPQSHLEKKRINMRHPVYQNKRTFTPHSTYIRTVSS